MTVAVYSPIARLLHWLTAIAVIAAIPLAIAMSNAPSGPVQNTLFDLHRSFGALILLLVLIRLPYRLFAGAPPPEPGLPRWQLGLSHAVHWLLYLFLLVMPIVGWVGTSAYGAPITVFWLFEMPAIVDKNEALANTLLGWHATAGLVMGGLVIIHIAAALYHRFVRHDGVLARMLPSAG